MRKNRLYMRRRCIEYLYGGIDTDSKREEVIACYISETGATVRQAAAKFGISKSTVHKDVSVKLKISNPRLYEEVKLILDKNKAERHLRGGEATRRLYMMKKLTNK